MKRKPKKRGFVRRPLSTAEKKRWNDAADTMLAHARDVYELSADFDTAVRDSIASGLAYLVHAAFDCRCIALDFKDESYNTFYNSVIPAAITSILGSGIGTSLATLSDLVRKGA